jgi:hypothetical protein
MFEQKGMESKTNISGFGWKTSGTQAIQLPSSRSAKFHGRSGGLRLDGFKTQKNMAVDHFYARYAL